MTTEREQKLRELVDTVPHDIIHYGSSYERHMPNCKRCAFEQILAIAETAMISKQLVLDWLTGYAGPQESEFFGQFLEKLEWRIKNESSESAGISPKTWLLNGGGGHEGGEDGLRALKLSGEGLVDFLEAYREHLAKPAAGISEEQVRTLISHKYGWHLHVKNIGKFVADLNALLATPAQAEKK